MKIVFLDAKTMGEVPNFQKLKVLGDFYTYPLTMAEDRIERMKDAVIVITCKVIIDKPLIDACPSLRLICVAATGTNNVDTVYAQSKGIQVKNVAGYSTESVAQVTVGMILSLVNKTHYYDQYVKSGRYTFNDMFTHFGPSFFELKGKTLGIIGLGNIGQRVSEIMKAFGMNIHYYSTSGNNFNNQYSRIELEQLLELSDIISIHCPLNERTRNLIAWPQLLKMKATAILINVSRGGIINEQDLVRALNANMISGFGTDVYEIEPIIANSPFFSLESSDQVIFSPHIAWTSIEARILLIDKLIKNINSFIIDNQIGIN
jgi:lactate dehydrogenase-like 2-hydroxyacid dehydrogenase